MNIIQKFSKVMNIINYYYYMHFGSLKSKTEHHNFNHFLREKHNTNSTTFQIGGERKDSKCVKKYRYVQCKLLEYYSIMMHSKFPSILLKNG